MTHKPPPFVSSSSSTPQSTSPSRIGSNKQHRLSRRSPLSSIQIVSFALVIFALVLQFLLPWRSDPQKTTTTSSSYYSSREHENLYHNLRRFDELPNRQCLVKHPLIPEEPVCQPSPYDPLYEKMAPLEQAQQIAKEFDYSAEDVNRGVKEFITQMGEGLGRNGATMAQIPTYVTAVPNGTEKGLYLAVDLGGTNFRVCSIQLHGDTTFSLTHTKVAVPRELMVAKTSKELFSFLAKQIETFLKTHHNDHYQAHVRKRKTRAAEDFTSEEIFNLGFTFSFPVHQVGINRGTLIRWTKGFDIEDTVGKDVCALLQVEIDALHLPVRVAALVNDTVGTLMARSYTSPGKTGTLIGAIFGTGTNGAYVEKLDRVKKMSEVDSSTYDSSTGLMIVNTEWGSFDNHLSVLPNTKYDADLDAESVNPGMQIFEKRVSGMFLGEILRRAILAIMQDPTSQLFKDETSRSNDRGTTTVVAEDSALYKQWGIDTSFLSIVEDDTSAGLRVVRQTLDRDLGVYSASTEDAQAVKALVHAIGKRAARLSAVALGAVVLESGKLDTDDVVDIGVDGSLVEFYPGFDTYIREALREIEGIGERESKIRIGIAKDGSGVGAALIALVAGTPDKPEEIVED